MSTKLTEEIEFYYNERGLVRPSAWHAFIFLMEEVGEVANEFMQWIGGYKRNNPSKEVRRSDEEHAIAIGEELGDVIMMAVMTGRAMGVDPIACMRDKMQRKLKKDLIQ